MVLLEGETGEKRLRYTSENQWSVGAMKPNVKIWFKLQEVIRGTTVNVLAVLQSVLLDT